MVTMFVKITQQFLQCTTIQRKRRRMGKLSKELSEQLKYSLLTERDTFMTENPMLRFVGPNVVCPTLYIESL